MFCERRWYTVLDGNFKYAMMAKNQPVMLKEKGKAEKLAKEKINQELCHCKANIKGKWNRQADGKMIYRCMRCGRSVY
jgi:hypothetical protein